MSLSADSERRSAYLEKHIILKMQQRPESLALRQAGIAALSATAAELKQVGAGAAGRAVTLQEFCQPPQPSTKQRE